ncbi:uncharacterized protein MONOS_4602 [Monocercomonoides exilis]|uniref:uncharacterized protein n=1 Tax=Monocercomonoides exilis TaxID=2049356 RepID=UPI00355980CE|nr:hypothetical protein MONOS_4602 [Monocercomonoides exilis]|eukprot:MONOS_4602.1-p1 / transcript=MONOS_4602.1 / gene=MONOS_4602 / organism=Monocercomonoides_exilis_PA203 / gene_product=unspecified product / transcript_product=unspecified product / location=Mono_scaffold00124:55659-61861(-) / protein_length=1945 / sequence_SO=supercontig / SO=protein_coding / is_pseudo=false
MTPLSQFWGNDDIFTEPVSLYLLAYKSGFCSFCSEFYSDEKEELRSHHDSSSFASEERHTVHFSNPSHPTVPKHVPTVVVSENGKDADDCGKENTPCATLHKAIARLDHLAANPTIQIKDQVDVSKEVQIDLLTILVEGMDNVNTKYRISLNKNLVTDDEQGTAIQLASSVIMKQVEIVTPSSFSNHNHAPTTIILCGDGSFTALLSHVTFIIEENSNENEEFLSNEIMQSKDHLYKEEANRSPTPALFKEAQLLYYNFFTVMSGNLILECCSLDCSNTNIEFGESFLLDYAQDSSLILTQCSFSSISQSEGSLIFNKHGPISLNGTVFKDITSKKKMTDGSGGAVISGYDTKKSLGVIIENCSFDGCSTSQATNGGAVFLESSFRDSSFECRKNVSVKNCKCERNGGKGGGMYLQFYHTNQISFSKEMKFLNNFASIGHHLFIYCMSIPSLVNATSFSFIANDNSLRNEANGFMGIGLEQDVKENLDFLWFIIGYKGTNVCLSDDGNDDLIYCGSAMAPCLTLEKAKERFSHTADEETKIISVSMTFTLPCDYKWVHAAKNEEIGENVEEEISSTSALNVNFKNVKLNSILKNDQPFLIFQRSVVMNSESTGYINNPGNMEIEDLHFRAPSAFESNAQKGSPVPTALVSSAVEDGSLKMNHLTIVILKKTDSDDASAIEQQDYSIVRVERGTFKMVDLTIDRYSRPVFLRPLFDLGAEVKVERLDTMFIYNTTNYMSFVTPNTHQLEIGPLTLYYDIAENQAWINSVETEETVNFRIAFILSYFCECGNGVDGCLFHIGRCGKGSSVRISNSVFTKIISTGSGGPIFADIEGNVTLEIFDCDFEGCGCKDGGNGNGGCVYVRLTDTSLLKITDCSFYNSFALNGGSIYLFLAKSSKQELCETLKYNEWSENTTGNLCKDLQNSSDSNNSEYFFNEEIHENNEYESKATQENKTLSDGNCIFTCCYFNNCTCNVSGPLLFYRTHQTYREAVNPFDEKSFGSDNQNQIFIEASDKSDYDADWLHLGSTQRFVSQNHGIDSEYCGIPQSTPCKTISEAVKNSPIWLRCLVQVVEKEYVLTEGPVRIDFECGEVSCSSAGFTTITSNLEKNCESLFVFCGKSSIDFKFFDLSFNNTRDTVRRCSFMSVVEHSFVSCYSLTISALSDESFEVNFVRIEEGSMAMNNSIFVGLRLSNSLVKSTNADIIYYSLTNITACSTSSKSDSLVAIHHEDKGSSCEVLFEYCTFTKAFADNNEKGGLLFLDYTSRSQNFKISKSVLNNVSCESKEYGKGGGLHIVGHADGKESINVHLNSIEFLSCSAFLGKDIFILCPRKEFMTPFMWNFDMEPMYNQDNMMMLQTTEEGNEDIIDLMKYPSVLLFKSNELHVSEGGEDSIRCGLKQFPCCTINEAISHCVEGESCIISVDGITEMFDHLDLTMTTPIIFTSLFSQEAAEIFTPSAISSLENTIVRCTGLCDFNNVCILYECINCDDCVLLYCFGGELSIVKSKIAPSPHSGEGSVPSPLILVSSGILFTRDLTVVGISSDSFSRSTEAFSPRSSVVPDGSQKSSGMHKHFDLSNGRDNFGNIHFINRNFIGDQSFNNLGLKSHSLYRSSFSSLLDDTNSSSTSDSDFYNNMESNDPTPSFCKWNDGCLVISHSSASIDNSTFINSSIGGIKIEGLSYVKIYDIKFLNNSAGDESYPSVHHNIICSGQISSTLEIISIQNGSDGYEDTGSLWLLNEGCTLFGNISHTRSSLYFIPRPMSVEKIDHPSNDSNVVRLKVTGEMLIPCGMCLAVCWVKDDIESDYIIYSMTPTENDSEAMATCDVLASDLILGNNDSICIRLLYRNNQGKMNCVSDPVIYAKADNKTDPNRKESLSTKTIIVIVVLSVVAVAVTVSCVVFVIFLVLKNNRKDYVAIGDGDEKKHRSKHRKNKKKRSIKDDFTKYQIN